MRVQLNGSVVNDDMLECYQYFGMAAFAPQTIRQAIADNPVGESLVFEVNSGGGSVFAGFEMYSILRNAKCETVVEVQSISASASSTMMCGATTVRLSPVAQVMIHLPATCTWGNQNDHRHSAGILESLTQSILNGYALRCGDKASREKLEDLTNKETWLTAQDAVLLGLANEVMYQEGEEALLPTNLINAIGSGIRSLVGGGVLDPNQLRQKWLEETKATPQDRLPEEPQSEPQDNWKDEAFLYLAQARYKIEEDEQ